MTYNFTLAMGGRKEGSAGKYGVGCCFYSAREFTENLPLLRHTVPDRTKPRHYEAFLLLSASPRKHCHEDRDVLYRCGQKFGLAGLGTLVLGVVPCPLTGAAQVSVVHVGVAVHQVVEWSG
jgi:hypothetical protein